MPSINQKINEDLIPFSIDLMRIESGLQRELLKEFRKLEKKLVAELMVSDPGGVRRTKFKEKRLQDLLKQVRASINSSFNKMYSESQKEMISLVDLTDKTIRGAANTAIGANIMTTTISPVLAVTIVDETAIAGQYQKDWYNKLKGDTLAKYRGAIREGMLKGEPTAEIVKRVIGTRGKKFKDGMTAQIKAQVNATVRSSVQNISNTARLKVYENNSNVVDGFTWVSTLDSRTTIICMSLDGLSWNAKLKPINHNKTFPGATAHFGCRSTQTPRIKAYNNMPKNVKKKIPEGTRASIDGQVAVSTNYEKFLKGKSETFQKKQLGATKYKLWKENKITFTDLIDQSGNPVSVAELLQKHAA